MSTKHTQIIRTVCRLTDWETCGLYAHVKDGKLIKVEPANDFPDEGYRHICARGLASIQIPYQPNRIQYPLKRVGERGEGKWKRISWDEALEIIADKLKEISNKYGPEALAVGGNISPCVAEAYQRFLSAYGGGSWLSTIGGYADAAGPGGDMVSYGWLLGELYNVDFEKPEVCIVWGGNPTDTMPMKWRRIRDAKEKGAILIVIDPVFTPTAAKADAYISIRPGTDTALAWAIMNDVIEKNAIDTEFISKYTVGPFLVRKDNGAFLREKDFKENGSDKCLMWDHKTDSPATDGNDQIVPELRGEFKVGSIVCQPAFQILSDRARHYSIKKVAGITGIPEEDIQFLAQQFTEKKPVASFRLMGLQRTFHGDLSWRAISTLQAITGNVRFQGAKRFILNSGGFAQGTIQDGSGSGGLAVIGETPARLFPLLELYDAVINGRPYPIKALFVSSANLLYQIPNREKVLKELIPNLEFIVDADIVMNPTAQYSDIVLPRCTFFECSDILPPGEILYHPYLQLQQAVIEPMYESKSDYEIISLLARTMGWGEHFEMSWEQFLERMLDSGHPSVKGATLQKLKQGPFKMPEHDVPKFLTGSGRIEFYAENLKQYGEELPEYLPPLETGNKTIHEKYPLAFLQTHGKHLMNSTFTDNIWLRELNTEPFLEMNPSDAELRGIKDGDVVTVYNDRGSVSLRAMIHEGIRPGVVNLKQGWWPEHFVKGSHQNLTHDRINPVHKVFFEPNASIFDVCVEVRK
jgi:anaerobic dimethyl sulfoxide reductase subunit A